MFWPGFWSPKDPGPKKSSKRSAVLLLAVPDGLEAPREPPNTSNGSLSPGLAPLVVGTGLFLGLGVAPRPCCIRCCISILSDAFLGANKSANASGFGGMAELGRFFTGFRGFNGELCTRVVWLGARRSEAGAGKVGARWHRGCGVWCRCGALGVSDGWCWFGLASFLAFQGCLGGDFGCRNREIEIRSAAVPSQVSYKEGESARGWESV